MYGTIAKFQVKSGKAQALRDLMDESSESIDGLVFEHVYRTDADPHVLYIVVAFESKEAYRKNAESQEMHQRYLQYRELLDAEPEWHDGEVIDSSIHDQG